jgi:hypothetical protein
MFPGAVFDFSSLSPPRIGLVGQEAFASLLESRAI